MTVCLYNELASYFFVFSSVSFFMFLEVWDVTDHTSILRTVFSKISKRVLEAVIPYLSTMVFK